MTSNTDLKLSTLTLHAEVIHPPTQLENGAIRPRMINRTAIADDKPSPGLKNEHNGNDVAMKRPDLKLPVNRPLNDKENSTPQAVLSKQKFTAKVVQSIAEKSRPLTLPDAVPGDSVDFAKTSFSLRLFNSVRLGRPPRFLPRPQPRRAIFAIKSSKPTFCKVTLEGLTIQVKIAN